MEQVNISPDMLDLIQKPAFYAQEGIITRTNAAAAQILLEPGTQICKLLLTGSEEYQHFSGDELYLTLSVQETTWGAAVKRIGDRDVFLLEAQNAVSDLQALSLAAQAIREPLSTVMMVAERLKADITKDATDAQLNSFARFDQSLNQILRLLGNMSDAGRFNKKAPVFTETCNIRSFIAELAECAGELVASTGRRLEYTGPEKDIYCLANPELLERAFYNLLSNAIKFSPENAQIRISLARERKKLYLTVENPIEKHSSIDFFTGYRREPGITDGTHGIGLGMIMIRSAATAHGGTVLVQLGETVKVTLSMEITNRKSTTLASNILKVDYAGQWDHRMLELSDALPFEAFRK